MARKANGRPPDTEQLHRIFALRLSGKSMRVTAKEADASRNTVAKWGRPEVIDAIRRLRPQCLSIVSEPPSEIISDSALGF
jgi:hypothetical protein